MQRLFSQLVGMPIYVDDSQQKVDRLFNLIMDPEKGDLVGIYTMHGKVVVPMDILPFEGDEIRISEHDALMEPEEILRVAEIEPKNRWILHKPVMTKDHEYLGRVEDFVLDMDHFMLQQLYVTKTFCFITTEKRLIPAKNIQEMTEEAIIVKINTLRDEKRLHDYFQLKKQANSPVPG